MDAISGHPDLVNQDISTYIRPNDAGEQAIVDKMLPYVKALLDRVTLPCAGSGVAVQGNLFLRSALSLCLSLGPQSC